ncbi:glucosamine 6-phosphate N-acetyltransferase-like [Anneissia japonica]|uniref:glucosamine 6-phosphate N-acetyltransferase-like n=1 Tax=Anneissia japonica TaxID=1529436 RepID=UPI0014256533|nr:glucosamine 6-phosphate N-acetyltransferase-like [Anneissia japonica]
MENSTDEIPIYNPDLLKQLDYAALTNLKYSTPRSPQNPGNSLIMRPLCAADYHKGFIELLRQLTSVGDVTPEQFMDHFQQMKSCNGTYYITVIEDISISKIVAAATLVVERKYIHACATRGMIEEVVVDSGYRGQQLGKLLMDTLTLLSKHTLGCYKTTLQCTEENIPFYEKFGFKKDPQVYMQHRHKP